MLKFILSYVPNIHFLFQGDNGMYLAVMTIGVVIDENQIGRTGWFQS